MTIDLRTLAISGAVAALALATTGCTQATAEPEAQISFDTERQCFFASTVNGFGDAPDGPDGEDRLVVKTGVRDDWLFESFGPCPELDFAQAIAFAPRTRTSICTGQTETLLVPSSISGQFDRCQVRLLGKVIEPAG
jgi:hypothetical protein